MKKSSEVFILMSAAAIFMIVGLGMIFLGWGFYAEREELLSLGNETEDWIVGVERVGAERENRLHENRPCSSTAKLPGSRQPNKGTGHQQNNDRENKG
jgi:hypothetical protein